MKQTENIVPNVHNVLSAVVPIFRISNANGNGCTTHIHFNDQVVPHQFQNQFEINSLHVNIPSHIFSSRDSASK